MPQLTAKQIERILERHAPPLFWRRLGFWGFLVAVLALAAAIYSNIQTLDALKESQLQTTLTLEALNEAKQQTELTRKSLEIAQTDSEQGRIIAAWQILTQKAPGNSGKVQALETLHTAGQSLIGIDLSCSAMGGMDNNYGTCLRKTILENAKLHGVNLAGANLTDVFLTGSNLSNATMVGTGLSRSTLRNTDLSGSNLLAAEMWSTKLTRANLTDANLTAVDFFNTNLDGANISGSRFCGSYPLENNRCAVRLYQHQIDAAWAWADNPPIFQYEEVWIDLNPPPLCAIKLRKAYLENRQSGKPKGC